MDTSTNGEICIFTGMTERQRLLLKDCWQDHIGLAPQLVDAAQEQFGVQFMFWLLETIPNAKKRFTKFDGTLPQEQLLANKEFRNHCRIVAKWFDSMIRLLDTPVELEMETHHLAITHLFFTPKIGSEYFDVFQAKFPQFMASQIKRALVDDEVKAWGMLANLISSKVKKSEGMIASQQCCCVL
ncbi:globin-like [Physella acuta]|uniref:globin-like n=1 Tax=Physella acuta TaxID=109671 RepID=UPI0027DBD615|nr:globin-like [Physella acuta]